MAGAMSLHDYDDDGDYNYTHNIYNVYIKCGVVVYIIYSV